MEGTSTQCHRLRLWPQGREPNLKPGAETMHDSIFVDAKNKLGLVLLQFLHFDCVQVQK